MRKEDQGSFYISPDGGDLSSKHKRGYKRVPPAEKSPKVKKEKKDTPFQEVMKYRKALEKWQDQSGSLRIENVNGGVEYIDHDRGSIHSSKSGEEGGEIFRVESHLPPKPDYYAMSLAARRLYSGILKGKKLKKAKSEEEDNPPDSMLVRNAKPFTSVEPRTEPSVKEVPVNITEVQNSSPKTAKPASSLPEPRVNITLPKGKWIDTATGAEYDPKRWIAGKHYDPESQIYPGPNELGVNWENLHKMASIVKDVLIRKSQNKKP